MSVGKSPRKPLPRYTPLRATGALPKVNPERKAKRSKRYSANLAKSRRGNGYREAFARAGGQCERKAPVPGTMPVELIRCPETADLQAHHLTYARFGGDELPEDYLICCKRCHDGLESLHPTRRRA